MGEFNGNTESLSNFCSTCGWALAVHSSGNNTCPNVSDQLRPHWIKRGWRNPEHKPALSKEETEMANRGRNRHETIPVMAHDLRALLYWASLGVSQNSGGTYANDIEEREGDPGIIRSYADQLGFKLPTPPKFKVVT